MSLDPELLKILACPGCKQEVKLVIERVEGGDVEKLICQNPDCGLEFPIRDGIPVMIIDEAEDPRSVRDRYR